MHHASYPETADIETSSDGYASRFAGPVGGWFLEVQGQLVRRALGLAAHSSVLDVGGGHAQIAPLLVDWGYRVTVIGSDGSCATRLRTLIDSRSVTFREGNLIELPFRDGEFDAVVSVRFLPHCEQWRRCIAELCRVARHQVVVDYPVPRGFNALSSLLFGWKKKLEGNTRTWLMFRDDEIEDEFAKHGFIRTSRKAQFAFPMVLYRKLGSSYVGRIIESVARALGVTGLIGSPVIAGFSRPSGRAD